MMADVGALEAGGIVAILTAIGGGVRWFYMAATRRHDKRERELDDREKRITGSTNLRLEGLQREIHTLGQRVSELSDVNAKQWTSIHLLVAEARRTDPDNPVISQVELILGKPLRGFPYGGVELPTPPAAPIPSDQQI